ncbi:hypothetical protein CWN94_17930 [Vibrio splendidus]|nr:hypothetical protein CWN94_17930 [Vibrio splendidus]
MLATRIMVGLKQRLENAGELNMLEAPVVLRVKEETMIRITLENSDITIWGLQAQCVLCTLC